MPGPVNVDSPKINKATLARMPKSPAPTEGKKVIAPKKMNTRYMSLIVSVRPKYCKSIKNCKQNTECLIIVSKPTISKLRNPVFLRVRSCIRKYFEKRFAGFNPGNNEKSTIINMVKIPVIHISREAGPFCEKKVK